MSEDAFRTRQAITFFIVNALAYGLVCVMHQRTGTFHLRLLCEAFSEAYLIALTLWAWLGTSALLTRLLLSLIGIVVVFAVSQVAIPDRFPSWIEVAMWYVPVTSILCVGLKWSGNTVQLHSSETQQATFSLRWMMVATGLVAVTVPAVRLLAQSRHANQFTSYQWLLDILVIVAPVSLIAVGIVWAVLSNKLFHAIAFVCAAPLIGLSVCQIYGWSHYQSIVIPITVSVLLITFLSALARMNGFRMVKLAQSRSQHLAMEAPADRTPL